MQSCELIENVHFFHLIQQQLAVSGDVPIKFMIRSLHFMNCHDYIYVCEYEVGTPYIAKAGYIACFSVSYYRRFPTLHQFIYTLCQIN